MKMHAPTMTISGLAGAATMGTHKDCGAHRWIAAITALPALATLPLLETRWGQRRAGSPLWRVITMQNSASAELRASLRRTARQQA